MTKQRDLKALVRERMAKTGESYQTAKRAVEAQRPVGPADDVNYLRGKATLLNEQAALLEQLEVASQRCQTEYGECVLPKGHRSEEHGGDHQSPDGVWWNVGWTPGDSKPREPGCLCHLEEGDSPCSVHDPDHVVPPLDKDGLCTQCGRMPHACACEAEPLERATCTQCGRVYSLHPTKSRRCEHCGHTPVELVPVRGFADPVPKEAAEAIDNLRRTARMMQKAEGEAVLKSVTERSSEPLPKAEHTLTMDVGDMPPEVAVALIERLKVQWQRGLRPCAISEEQRAAFDRQAEEMALTAAAEMIPKLRAEVEFLADVKKAVQETLRPEVRPEGPAPSELLWKAPPMTDEEKKALDEAMAKQPPCTCHVQHEACRFHRAPIVEYNGLGMPIGRSDDVSITSRTGDDGRTDFWLTQGGKDVYRLGYKDQSGKTILGNEGACTCRNRDGMDYNCAFHHPPREMVDVVKKLTDAAYRRHVERIQNGEPGEVGVVVNGLPFTVERRVTYEAVCARAKLNPSLNPSVTYRGKRMLKPWEAGRKPNDPVTPEPDWVRVEGILSPGRSVDAEPGMVFNAVYTGNA